MRPHRWHRGAPRRHVRAIVAAALLLAAACAGPSGDPAEPRKLSEVAPDESVVFFRTAGWLDADRRTWHLPVHGWIYEPEDSRFRKSVIGKVLESFDLRPEGAAETVFATRLNWLLADNERGKVLHVRIGDRDFELPPSDEHGQFRTTIGMPVEQVRRIAEDGEIRISAVTREAVPRTFGGVITLVPPDGVSVISDIDDTVKISHVTERARLLEYTLLREFEAVPGMADLYAAWARSGAVIHFVSSSPWQLYPELEAFVDRVGIPAASFHLKRVRFRDETLLDLFATGADTKPAQLEPLLRAWPKRTFVLVGDSGEHDPEVYADLMRRYPDRIQRIYIRNVTGAAADDGRMRAVFDGVEPARWQLFSDPGTLGLVPVG